MCEKSGQSRQAIRWQEAGDRAVSGLARRIGSFVVSTPKPALHIRGYRSVEFREIADLFHAAVHAVNTDLYSREQQLAWSSTPPNYLDWRAKLKACRPFVAVRGRVIVGFVQMGSDGYIDCLYVHPDHQRQGIATALVQHAIAANEGRIDVLLVHASLMAKPLFEKLGFEDIRKNSIELRGQILTNYTMVRRVVF